MGAIRIEFHKWVWRLRIRRRLDYAERAATAIEYVLIASLISIVGILAITGVGGEVLRLIQSAADAFP